MLLTLQVSTIVICAECNSWLFTWLANCCRRCALRFIGTKYVHGALLWHTPCARLVPLLPFQAVAVGGADGGVALQPLALQGRTLHATDNSSSSSSSSDGLAPAPQPSASPAAPKPKRKRCMPSLIDVARQQPDLRQAVQFAKAGFNLFAIDGGKPFTALVPVNAAFQALAQSERVAQPVACCPASLF
jgi:hypothetical protein